MPSPTQAPRPAPEGDPKRAAQWWLAGLFIAIAALVVLLYKVERHYGLHILFRF